MVTASCVFFVQAKDSPNIERILRRPIDRKKTVTTKALKKAAGQMRGAFRYAKSESPIPMIVGGKTVEISLEGLAFRALIVVKVLFMDEYSVYTPPLLNLARELSAPCLPLDDPELHMYTRHLNDEEAFVEAWDRVFTHGVESGMFPRLRFGPIDS